MTQSQTCAMRLRKWKISTLKWVKEMIDVIVHERKEQEIRELERQKIEAEKQKIEKEQAYNLEIETPSTKATNVFNFDVETPSTKARNVFNLT